MYRHSWHLTQAEWDGMSGPERFWHCVRQAAFFRSEDRRWRRKTPNPLADWSDGLLQILRSGHVMKDIGYCPPLNLLELGEMVWDAGYFRADDWRVTSDEWKATLDSETYRRKVASIALQFYEMRASCGETGTAQDDWMEAEQFIRREIEAIKIALYIQGCKDDALKLRLMVLYFLAVWAGLRPSEVTDETSLGYGSRHFSVLFKATAEVLRIRISQLPAEAKTVGEFVVGLQEKFARQ